jgi:hypothetical protein
MTSRLSRWKDHDHWQCLKHVPPVTLPESSGRCWFAGCSQRPDEADRPLVEVRPPEPEPIPRPARAHTDAPRPTSTRSAEMAPERAAVLAEGVVKCALETCAKPARAGSKYCSRVCSNRNARRRFKARARVARRAARAAAAEMASSPPQPHEPLGTPRTAGGVVRPLSDAIGVDAALARFGGPEG